MTIGETHLTISELAQVSLTINTVRFNQDILGLAAIRAAIHAQRAADRSRNAAQKCKPGNARRLRGARHHNVEHRGTGGDAMILDFNIVEAATQADHHSRHTPVAHNQVRSGADHRDRSFPREISSGNKPDRFRPPA